MIAIVAVLWLFGYMLTFASIHKGGFFATRPWEAFTVDYTGDSVGAIESEARKGGGFWRELWQAYALAIPGLGIASTLVRWLIGRIF